MLIIDDNVCVYIGHVPLEHRVVLQMEETRSYPLSEEQHKHT